MPARTGRNYIDSLRDDRRIFVNGERVRDVTQYPGFRHAIEELAQLYDYQHDPRYQDALTYTSPSSGEPVGTSFIAARTWEDVQCRLAGDRLRCELTNGMMGRLPDQMSAVVTGLAQIRGLLGSKDPSFGENAWNYYELCRERDLCLTHTLVDPQVDRSKGVDAQEALRVVKETDAGLIVRGARMLSTLAPLSEELWVGPYMPRRQGEEAYALCFSIPVATPGLTFVCREPYDTGRDEFDRPLSSHYDEEDAFAIFDDVLVPWERVFCAQDIEIYNSMGVSQPGYSHLHTVSRGLVKLRFLIGVASLVADAVGRSQMPRYQEMIGELVGYVELIEGCLQATAKAVYENVTLLIEHGEMGVRASSEKGVIPGVGMLFSAPGRSAIGITTVRLLIPQAIAKAVEVIRMVGSSGLVMTPTAADLTNPEIKDLLAIYLKGRDMPADERVAIMRLAWDATSTQFGGRQQLYEAFYAGDPINNRIIYYATELRKECTAMAQQFLDAQKLRRSAPVVG